MGLIGEVHASASPKFLYDFITPDFSRRPKRPNNPFQGKANYPTSTIIFNQRRIFLSTFNNPLTFYASAVGKYNDFSLTEQADGFFELTLDSENFDPINYAVASQFGLALFSERNVWFVLSREGGGLTAANAFIKGELDSGAKKDLVPLNILNHILFVSNLDNTPRALSPVNTTPNQFDTRDLGLYSSHLFGVHRTFIESENIASTFDPRHRTGAEIISWTYAGRPHRLIWAVRADGTLLSCTYSPEHDVNAWSRHTTQGRFRAVQAVHEKNQDTVYMVVERGEHKFIESFTKRDVPQLEDAVPVDAAVRTMSQEPSEPAVLRIYDFVNGKALGEDSTTRFAIAAFAGYTGLGAVLPDDSVPTFSVGIVGDWLKTHGGIYKVTSRIDDRNVQIEAVREVPESDNEYFVHGTSVRHPVFQWEVLIENRIRGAYHLQGQKIVTIEGQDVTYNRTIPSAGFLSPVDPNTRGMIAGLPFSSHFESLPLILAGSVVEHKLKNIKGISVRFIDSSAMRAGAENELYPVFFSNDGEAEVLFKSGVEDIPVAGEWSLDEPLRIESLLPFTVLGMVIEVDIGEQSRAQQRLPGQVQI